MYVKKMTFYKSCQCLSKVKLTYTMMLQLKSMSLQYVLITISLAVSVQTVCIYPSDQSYISYSDCVSLELLFKEQVWSPGTSVKFSVGIYSLSNNSSINSFLVRDTSNISFLGDAFGPTVIECDGRLGFTFINVTNLTIANIQFMQCGTSVDIREALKVQTDSIPPGTKAAHFLVNIHVLFMINVSISESYGYGLLCVNMHDESHIVKTNFTFNHRYTNSRSSVGGSIFLLYVEDAICPSEVTWISMMSNIFFYNFASHDRTYKHTKASCLVIVIKQTYCSIHVSVHQSVFDRNYVPIVAMYDLNMWVSYEIVIRGSNFTNSLARYLNYPITATIMYTNRTTVDRLNTCLSGKKTMVRGIYINNCVFSDVQVVGTTFGYIDVRLLFNVTIIIEKCVFLPNIFQSAITIRQVNTKTHSDKFMSINECTFKDLKFNAIFILSNNDEHLNIKITNSMFRNISTKVLAIYRRPPRRNDQLSLFIENTTFIHNKHYSLHAFQVNNLTLAGNKFIENDDTPIVCEGSKMYFSGTTYITGNKGYNGGALLVSTAVYFYRHSKKWKLSPSVLYFHPDTRLILRNNRASNKGGAIYVDIDSLYNLYHGSMYDAHKLNYDVPCFYQLAPVNKFLEYHRNKSITTHVPQITFINNTARFAGDSIFGGLYEGCYSKTSLITRIKLEDLINISHQLSSSEIADNPNRICLCSGSVADCSQQLFKSVSLYQGQSIHMHTIATRVENHYANYGATPAVINIWIDQTHFDARVGKGQSAHKLDNKCSEIILSIYSHEPYVKVMILLNGEITTFMTVNLLGCPFGFQLENSRYPGCVCDSIVEDSGCTCSIDNLTISCPFGKWIGNVSNNTIVHHHCPFDYCKSESDIKVTDALDDQCAYNRSGILCGGCQPGLSLVLGNSNCEDCSNMPLFLILAFVLSGLTLVLLLYGCNLTVSRGTINGLIYFSNVVQVNGSIFVTRNTLQFFVVFIAWANLDLGIQTCFYSGMDMYAKAWLQFVFPVYMWLIVAVIVVLSRHSVIVSRMTRDNTVPVLATLFLLSYTKLLRAIITAFSFTYLRHPDRTHIPVWMYDGNVPFAKGKHIALLIAALVAMFGFIIPYTLLLLLSPHLQRWSHYKSLKWVNKLKPFLDANHGPYKNKMRNWTGVILLIRAIQFTCFAANAEGDPNINLMVILLIGLAPYLVVWIFGTVYKSKANSILESVFILLLSILASASLYIRTTSLDVEGKQTAITSSVFAAAFSLFLIIVTYHLFMLIRSTISKLTEDRNFLCTIMADASATELSSKRANDQKFSAPSVSYIALSELTPQSDN